MEFGLVFLTGEWFQCRENRREMESDLVCLYGPFLQGNWESQIKETIEDGGLTGIVKTFTKLFRNSAGQDLALDVIE